MFSPHDRRRHLARGQGVASPAHRRRSTWRLTWPFLLLVPLLLLVASAGIVIQGVGHVVVENTTRWERAQRSAFTHLIRYTDSCDPAEFQRYLEHVQVLWAFEDARASILGPNRNGIRAKAAYLRAGVSSGEAELLVRVLPLLQRTELQTVVKAVFAQANDLAHQLDQEAAKLHRTLQGGCLDPALHAAALAPILDLDEQIDALRQGSTTLASQARWRLNEAVLKVMLVLVVPLTVGGYLLSARLQRGAVRATDALDVSEHRLQRALTGSGAGLWDMEVSTGATYCSASLMQMLGREERDQTLPHTEFMALMHPDEADAVAATVLQRIKDGQRLDIELRLRSADGRHRWFRMAGQVARSDRGGPAEQVERRQPTRLIGSLFDIDDRHALQRALEDELEARRSAVRALRATIATLVERTEPLPTPSAPSGDDMAAVAQAVADLGRQLRQTNSQLEAIIDLSPDGFVSFDKDERVGFVSPRIAELTGLPAARLQGQHATAFFDRLTAMSRAGVSTPSLRLLRHRGSTEPLVLELATDPPRYLALQLRSGPHEEARDVLCMRDVSREHEVDRMKSEFLTVASHELRTPVTSIFGYIDLMQQREMSPQALKNVQSILHRQSRLLMSILDDLTDLSRLESGSDLRLSVSEVSLSDLLHRTVSSFSVPDGRERPRLLSPDTWPNARVVGDAGQLQHMFRNILSNAYTYSPDGGPVDIDLVLHAGSGSVAELRVGIRDHGIGMTAAQLARVGQRFFRADGSGHIPGTGLGMAIVSEILKLHGGRLDLTSAPGEGTRVEVVLPALVGRTVSDGCPEDRRRPV